MFALCATGCFTALTSPLLMKIPRLFVLLFVAVVPPPVLASDYFVSPSGSDAHSGAADAPFRTISKAVSVLKPGDTCTVRAGVYRETVDVRCSGTAEQPIRILGETHADGSPAVRIDGTESISTVWSPVTVNGAPAYATPLVKRTQQLFYRQRMMTEARWPDQRFDEIWDRRTWAQSAEGSQQDRMVCDALAETGIDWTGAMATLNVGHQFRTWSRPVLEHTKGANEFRYELGVRMNDDKSEGRTWWDDRFFLTGKIEALTSPEEWFYDPAAQRLLFISPSGEVPNAGDVAVKARNYGFRARDIMHVELSGFNLFACTISVEGAEHLLVENCRVLYPNYAPVLTDTMVGEARGPIAQTHLAGNHITVRKVSVAYSNTGGIKLTGTHNRIENCIVHDVCWLGNLNHPSIMIHSNGGQACNSTVSHCTIYNSGNMGIWYLKRNNRIEYNHVYNTGLACKDIAAIHTGSPNAKGSVACYNWVHGSRGKGIRGDDQTRGVTFHHNVIWDCDEGMILKGDFNRCYNNTILGKGGHGCLIIPTRPEPRKWWAKAEFLDVQNTHSEFFNNLVESIEYRYEPLPNHSGVHSNREIPEAVDFQDWLVDPDNRDFRPRQDASLEGIGAYEPGSEAWRPGADWRAPDIGIELPIHAEVARSWDLPSASRNAPMPLPKKLLDSNLSQLSKNKLLALYQDCWTKEELIARRDLVRERGKYQSGSPDFVRLQKDIVTCHRMANQRLARRAGEVLAGSELKLFESLMPSS